MYKHQENNHKESKHDICHEYDVLFSSLSPFSLHLYIDALMYMTPVLALLPVLGYKTPLSFLSLMISNFGYPDSRKFVCDFTSVILPHFANRQSFIVCLGWCVFLSSWKAKFLPTVEDFSLWWFSLPCEYPPFLLPLISDLLKRKLIPSSPEKLSTCQLNCNCFPFLTSFWVICFFCWFRKRWKEESWHEEASGCQLYHNWRKVWDSSLSYAITFHNIHTTLSLLWQ